MIVYTALFGDVTRDRLTSPPAGLADRCVCFTDAPLTVSGWEIRRLSSVGRSPSFLARLVKTRPDRWFGPDATTLWVDASCELQSGLTIAPEGPPIIGLRHPDRSSVDAEAAEIIRLGLAPADVVYAQLDAYRADGFATNGRELTTTGVLLRRPEAHAFNLLWEDQIIRYNLRDQLSIDYCAWKTGRAITYWPGSYRDNEVMRYHRHARLAS